MSQTTSLVSNLIPGIDLPDLGRWTLPGGTRIDLRSLDNTAEHALTTTAELLVATLLGLFIIGLGWIVSNKLASIIQRGLVKLGAEVTFAAFMGSVGRYVLFFSSVILALKLLGVSTTGALALFGAAGLATAFALRDTLTHLASGIMLMANRPFKVGDYIEIVDGSEHPQGTVKRITLFNTEVNTLTNERLFFPNSKLWGSVILNHSYNEARMLTLRIPLASHASLTKIRTALLPILQTESRISRRLEPQIGFEKFNDKTNSLILQVNVWLRNRDYEALSLSLMGTVLEALHRARVPLSDTPRRRAHD